MSDLVEELRCFNPRTGNRDGEFCVWEGAGKCLSCTAADEIESLQARIAELESDVVERDAIWLPEKDARIERLEEMIKNRDAALKEIDETIKGGRP